MSRPDERVLDPVMSAYVSLPDHHRHEVPKVPLYAAGALILMTLLLVAFVRLTGIGELRTPKAPVLIERLLTFADQTDGGIAVFDAVGGHSVARIEPGHEGFLRGSLRGLARERKRERIGPEVPFRLSSRADGRLLLEDPATGRVVDLGAFGAQNVAVFARMLAHAPSAVVPDALSSQRYENPR